VWMKRNCGLCILDGMQDGASATKTSMVVPQKLNKISM
jgi:hypothetical protein